MATSTTKRRDAAVKRTLEIATAPTALPPLPAPPMPLVAPTEVSEPGPFADDAVLWAIEKMKAPNGAVVDASTGEILTPAPAALAIPGLPLGEGEEDREPKPIGRMPPQLANNTWKGDKPIEGKVCPECGYAVFRALREGWWWHVCSWQMTEETVCHWFAPEPLPQDADEKTRDKFMAAMKKANMAGDK